VFLAERLRTKRESSFQAEQFTPPLKSFLQGWSGLRRIKERSCDLPLVLDGESDNPGSLDGAAGGFTRRRHDKICENTPFDFRSTASAARERLSADAPQVERWFVFLLP